MTKTQLQKLFQLAVEQHKIRQKAYKNSPLKQQPIRDTDVVTLEVEADGTALLHVYDSYGDIDEYKVDLVLLSGNDLGKSFYEDQAKEAVQRYEQEQREAAERKARSKERRKQEKIDLEYVTYLRLKEKYEGAII